MKRIWICLVLTFGCGTYAPARGPTPAPLTRNLELESFEQAVRWPNPTPAVVMQLVSHYLAVHREEDGYHYFAQRAAAVPAQPLFRALEGLFQIRMSWRIPLLRRTGWVREGIAKLDEAAPKDGLARYLRGLVFAELPPRFGKAQTAIDDLNWMLAHADAFPPGFRRGAERGIARAKGEATNLEPLLTDYAVNATDGFRFSPKAIVEPAPNVYLLRGYDFADLAFVVTSDGLVAIDAGTTPANLREALTALRQRTSLPIRTVIVTHAHWDHIGGLSALLGPHVQVIAQARSVDELKNVNRAEQPFRYFFGASARGPYTLEPDRSIDAPTTLTIGDTRFALYPAHGGETDDALLVHLPDSGVLFVGDAFMPYFGAPFVPEGSYEGLMETVAQIERLQPRLLIHGHAPLTQNFTAAALGPLARALSVVERQVTADLHASKTLPELLDRNLLPDELVTHPESVLPFLLMRDNLIKRLYAQRSGYWKSDGEGMEVLSPRERGAALDLLASPARIAASAHELNARGDYALALELCNQALSRHEGHRELIAARRTALDGLRTKHQLNPFKFLIYSEMLGRELAPPL